MPVPFVSYAAEMRDELRFQVIEVLFESDRIGLGIGETFDPGVQPRELLLGILTHLGQRECSIHRFPRAEHRDEQVGERRTVREGDALRRVEWVDRRAARGQTGFLIVNRVTEKFTVCVIPPDLENPRVGDLRRFFR